MENGRHQYHKRKSSSLPTGGKVTKRWMGYQELSAWTGGKKESKVCKLKDKKQITPWFGGGLRGQDFLVSYISQSVYKLNADRKFYSSLTVQQELHPSPDAGIRSPLPARVWVEIAVWKHASNSLMCSRTAQIQMQLRKAAEIWLLLHSAVRLCRVTGVNMLIWSSDEVQIWTVFVYKLLS